MNRDREKKNSLGVFPDLPSQPKETTKRASTLKGVIRAYIALYLLFTLVAFLIGFFTTPG